MLSPERTAARVALAGIAASAVLAALKTSVGLAAHSVATVSDGVESAADVISSGLVYVGLRIAAKPPDEDHPYGHGRFETLTALAVGVLLAAAGAAICGHSLEVNQQTPALFAIWPLALSILTKAVLAVVKMRAARAARSAALTADAWNDSVDILSGSVALISVLLAVYNPTHLHDADRYGGFLIGLIVIFMGFRVVRETALQLMDTMPEPVQMAALRAEALGVPGALGIDKCFARKTGLRYHVDLHLEVDPNLTVMESHEIARAVKRHLKNRLDWVADVLVHVEPHL
ncbi:MAG TPA: cation diffusion facilitator family transporter [Bryobacteraceae bacterium]|jgi:cation diffusion facilitator family transporter|nr:cation diffusion facilitator family transporter [Bryobacteraceae bacterium]